MEVNDNVKKIIVNYLPKNIELCNDRIIHNKVHTNKFLYKRIIPKGNKCLIWFKKDNKNNIFSYLITLHKNKVIKSIKKYNICFHKHLTTGKNGTIIYGTFFNYNDLNLFTIEDIYYFMNTYINKKSWDYKLYIINELMNNYVEQKYYTNNDIILGTVTILKLSEDIEEYIYNIPYNIYGIQYINNNIQYIDKNIEFNSKILNIKPCIQNDIYQCFDDNNNDYGILHIPDYKTSVMMNNIFRNIRENNNLDYLEESDDEDNFENINDNKYVNIDKVVKCKCIFNKKFKMWSPIEIL